MSTPPGLNETLSSNNEESPIWMLCQKMMHFSRSHPTEPLFLAKPWAQILTKRHLRNQADIFIPNISSEPDHIHTARRPTKAEMNECTYCIYLPVTQLARLDDRATKRSCERHNANSFVPKLSLITERFVNCWCHFWYMWKNGLLYIYYIHIFEAVWWICYFSVL